MVSEATQRRLVDCLVHGFRSGRAKQGSLYHKVPGMKQGWLELIMVTGSSSSPSVHTIDFRLAMKVNDSFYFELFDLPLSLEATCSVSA